MTKRYGMFGLTEEQVKQADALHFKEPHIYLTPEQVHLVLKDGTYWRAKINITPDWGESYEMDIWHKRKWLSVARVDLYNQVASSMGWTSEHSFYRNPLKSLRESAVYGGRVTKDSFYIIDSLTDG